MKYNSRFDTSDLQVYRFSNVAHGTIRTLKPGRFKVQYALSRKRLPEESAAKSNITI